MSTPACWTPLKPPRWCPTRRRGLCRGRCTPPPTCAPNPGARCPRSPGAPPPTDMVTIVENWAPPGALDLEAGRITGLLTEQGRVAVPQVVVAGGAWSSLFLRAHGVTIPQLAVRASVMAVQAPAMAYPGAAEAGGTAWRPARRWRLHPGARFRASAVPRPRRLPPPARLCAATAPQPAWHPPAPGGAARLSRCLDDPAPLGAGWPRPLRGRSAC